MTRPGRWLPLLLVALATLTGIALTAQPAEAGSRHHRGSLSYAALGDSYAAGYGAGRYVNDCFQSRRGYPALLDRQTRASLRTNASCNGATTTSVIATQVPRLDRHTRLVTLTVGGNDLGVANIAAVCTRDPGVPCQTAIAAANRLLIPLPGGGSELSARLAATYQTVAAAAPRADILVTGYPYLFELPSPKDPNEDTILALNDATTALNDTIRATVAAVAKTGVRIGYVDVTAGFAGHGIGSDRPYLHTAGLEVYHPTARGYRVYANALAKALTRT